MKSKLLAKTILAGLMGNVLIGGMAANVQAAVYSDVYITGDVDKDTPDFPGAKLKNVNGVSVLYDFSKQDETTIEGNFGILSSAKLEGDVKAKKLNINAEGGMGIVVGNRSNLTITADELNLVVDGTDNAVDVIGVGLLRTGKSRGSQSNLIINAPLVMKGDKANPYGLFSNILNGGAPLYKGTRWAPAGIAEMMGQGSVIEFKKPIDIAVKGIAVKTDPYYHGKEDPRTGKKVDDLKLSTIKIPGGKIITPDDNSQGYYALASFGGTINVNDKINKMTRLRPDSKQTVEILGNIIVTKEENNSGGEEFYRDGEINLGLVNEKSSWTGVIDNAGGEKRSGNVNLTLSNGASWHHRGVGSINGLDVDTMLYPSIEHYGQYDGVSYVNRLRGEQNKLGYIYQEDEAKIQINKLFGGVKVFYNHLNDGQNSKDFLAGDIIVKAASDGEITLSTDNKNIDINNQELVNKVLNNLAHKLYYLNAQTEAAALKGQVEITEGLVSSSQSLKLGNITFNKNNQGEYLTTEAPKEEVKEDKQPGVKPVDPSTTETKPVVEPTKPVITPGKEEKNEVKPNTPVEPAKPVAPTKPVVNNGEFNKTLTGGKIGDQVYRDAGVVDGSKYTFTTDTKIINTGGNVIDLLAPVEITAPNLTLGVTEDTNNLDNNLGINVTIPGQTSITAKNIKIKTIAGKSLGKAVAINLENKNPNQQNEVNINGSVDMEAQSTFAFKGINVEGNSKLNINGNVTGSRIGNIEGSKGNVDNYGGIMASADRKSSIGGEININGLVDLEVDGTGVQASDAHATVNIAGGKIAVKAAAPGDEITRYAVHTVNAGHVNINMADGKVGNNKVAILGNVGMEVATNYIKTHHMDGVINLGLNTADSQLNGVIIKGPISGSKAKKGATNTVNLYLANGATWNNEAQGFVKLQGKNKFMGSQVDKLIGAKDGATPGYINQRDSLPLTIHNLEGKVQINFAHNEAMPQEINGGKVEIMKAVPEAEVIVHTNSQGIDFAAADKTTIKNVLTNLAGKVQYTEKISGADNLKGSVEIGEGLVASAVKINRGITFSPETGLGMVDTSFLDEVKPNTEEKPANSEVTPGTGVETGSSEDVSSPEVSPTPGEEQPPVQPPRGEQNPPVEPPTGETTPPATGGDSGTSTTPPTTGEGSSSQEQPVPPTTGEGSGSQEQPVQPSAGEQPGTQPGEQPQQPPVVPSKPMAPPNINLGNYETAVMKSIRASQSVSVLALREMANDVTKRLGDLHFNQGDAGLWAKVESDKHNYDKRNVYGEYNGKAVHVGYDKKVNNNWLVGGQFTHLTGDTKYSDGKGNSSLNTIGLYGTKVNDNGSYVDIITKFGKLRNDYKVNTKEFNLAGKAKQNVQSFSVETGRRFTKDNGSFFEPQAELIYSHLPQADYYLTDGEHTLAVKQGSLDSLVARLGLAVGRKTDTSSIQAKLSIHNELLGTTSTVFKGENTKTVKYDYSGTWFTLGLAGTKQVSNGANVYGEITKAFGGGYSKAWNINLGARWMF